MKKNSNDKKAIAKIKEIALRTAIAELSEISKKREKELQEIDRIAKLLVRRDFELSETLKDMEEARGKAEEEKNKTLAVITNFTDGLLVFDKESNLALVNPKAEELLGIKNENIVGKSISELSEITAIKPLIEILGEKIEGIFRKELNISEDLILEVSTVPVIKEKEKLGTLVILHNITREKLIEKMKTEFVSLAAHQLRTPLSAIKWTVKMVLDEELGKINKEQREFLTDSYNSNERMITLINNLLNVARIEEGRYVFRPILVDIEEITKNVIDSYKEEAQKGGLKFEFEEPKEKLPKIVVDVEKIRIAIDNLIRNAVKYTLSGNKVIISLKYNKKEIEFSVRDTGVGIPRQQQKRIFTKFFRAANVVRMETEGAGLGLYITKNIIEAHGGRIWFKSELRKGTTFWFTLPIR